MAIGLDDVSSTGAGSDSRRYWRILPKFLSSENSAQFSNALNLEKPPFRGGRRDSCLRMSLFSAPWTGVLPLSMVKIQTANLLEVLGEFVSFGYG